MNKKEIKYFDEIIKEKSKFGTSIKKADVFLIKTILKYKKLLDSISEQVDDLYWEYDRMSSSGSETLDKLAKSLGMKGENK